MMFIKYTIPLAVGLSVSVQTQALTLQESIIAASSYNAELNAARRTHDADGQKKIRAWQGYYPRFR